MEKGRANEQSCQMTSSQEGRKVHILFDFDWSLIDCNSDTWVVKRLGAADLMRSLSPSLPWTQLMDRMMSELILSGRTMADIDNCLKDIPFHPSMIMAIKEASTEGCDLQIISDANSYFIRTILESNNLQQYFSAIYTNPAHIDDKQVLRINPYHAATEMPHGCPLCPPNMCKGSILDRVRSSMQISASSRLIYVGDGKGDYCPSLKLTKEDHVLAREGFPLSKCLDKNPNLLKAQLHRWSSAEDIHRCLGRIVKLCCDLIK